MRYQYFIAALSFVVFTSNLSAQSFNSNTTSVSNVRMSVSNFGTFGNSFDGYRDGTGNPSCEYPANSGIEHLFEGGLWIGGRFDGSSIRVTTTAIDNSSGYTTGSGGFESMASGDLAERSDLFDSRFYSPDAVSNQDFVSVFSDTTRFYPGTSIEVGGGEHLPLGIQATLETYNWTYSFSDFVVFVNVTYKNIGQSTIEDLYVGLWNNTVVRNINVTTAGTGGANFYNKGGNGYMDSLHLAYCYDATGDVGFTESYIGQKFLGAEDKYGFHHPDLDSNFETTYNAWVFNTFSGNVFNAPSDDGERYSKMTDGLNESPCWNNPSDPNCPGSINLQSSLNDAGNRSDLVSAGPFASFEPGDEITVSFAYVLAKKNEDGNPNTSNNATQRKNLMDNALFAQETYNGEDINFNGILDQGEDLDGDGKITRFVLPTPPDAPSTKIIPSEGKIDIYWSNNSEFSIDPISNEMDFEGYRLYATSIGFDVSGTQNLSEDLNLVAQYDIPGNGISFETGFNAVRLDQPVYFDNDSTPYYYKYTLNNVSNGWQYAVSVTAFDRGDEERGIQSLESSAIASDLRAFPGLNPNADIDKDQPFAYPNPYYYGAAWEGVSNFQEESRKLIFANLPKRCEIRVYTAGGDFIDMIDHDEAYNGQDTRWYRTFGAENAEENVFSGGEHAWDLLTSESQIISRGLYLFVVKDLDTGKERTGKFVIIK